VSSQIITHKTFILTGVYLFSFYKLVALRFPGDHPSVHALPRLLGAASFYALSFAAFYSVTGRFGQQSLCIAYQATPIISFYPAPQDPRRFHPSTFDCLN
jgi:hypothetical protein